MNFLTAFSSSAVRFFLAPTISNNSSKLNSFELNNSSQNSAFICSFAACKKIFLICSSENQKTLKIFLYKFESLGILVPVIYG
jgi:hypothetical protein